MVKSAVAESCGRSTSTSGPAEDIRSEVDNLLKGSGTQEATTAICLDSIRKQLEEANCMRAIEVAAGVPQPAGRKSSCGRGEDSTSDPYNYQADENNNFEGPAVHASRADLVELCERLKVLRPIIRFVAGRRVVILLGNTGTGKTTVLHHIAKKELRRVRYRQHFSASFEKDVYEPVEAMEGFNIGHDQISETPSISHFERVSDDCGEEDPVVYLDTPGYEDTSGPLVDLATSVSFRKVAEVCKMLRFVVLINAGSFLERGNGIREVVKLISSVVGDFDEHRFVFTFLFTHTNSLKEMVDKPMSEVREKLGGWAADTARGSSCPKEQNVLKWISHCLLKQLKFVDVFHPENSSVESVVASTEMFEMLEGERQTALGLKDRRSARDIVRCGMTRAAESTLKLELDQLLLDLKDSLKSERLDVIPRLVHTLMELSENVGTSAIKAAWGEGEELVKRKCADLMTEVDQRLLQATDLKHGFNAGEGRRMLECAAVLQALAELGLPHLLPANAGQAALCRLRTALAQLASSLPDDLAGKELGEAQGKLLRLQAWSEVHNDFRGLLRAGLCTLINWMEGATADAWSEDEEEAISALARLNQVHLQSEGLRMLGVGVTAALQAFVEVSGRLQQRMTDDASEAKGAINQLSVTQGAASEAEAVGLEEPLKVFQERSLHLEHLTGLFGPVNLHELEQAGASMSRELLEKARRAVAVQLEAVQADVAGAASSLEVAQRVSNFQALRQHLSQEQCTQTSADQLFAGVLRDMLAEVRHLEAQLTSQCETLPESGLGAPEGHTKALRALGERTWLDKYLIELGDVASPQPPSVAGLLNGFEARYSKYFKDSATELTRALQDFLGNPRAAAERVVHIQRVLPEALSVSLFAECFPGLANVRPELESRIDELTQAWCRQHRRSSLESETPVSLDAIDARSLDEMLMVCCVLNFLDAQLSRNTFERHSTEVHGWLHPLQQDTASLLQAQGQFQKMRTVMDTLANWEQHGFSHLQELFPRLEDFKDRLKRKVHDLSSRAQEALVDRTSGDLAQGLLAQLQEAQLVDDHIGGMAGREDSLLKHCLHVRQMKLDEALHRQIESCDFEGIENHLEPMLTSSLPVVMGQLAEVVEAIASSVSSRVAAAHASLHSGPDAVNNIDTLERAAKNVGELLQERTSLRVNDEVSKLRRRVHDLCSGFLDRFESALDPLDGRSLMGRYRTVLSYLAAVQPIVGKHFHSRMVSGMQTALQRLEHVIPLSENFLCDIWDSTKLSNNQHPGTSQLVELLRQLKYLVDFGAHDFSDAVHKAEAEAPSLERRLWIVVGGSQEGGITVTTSGNWQRLPERLAHGALVAQLAVDGDWLHYEKLTGTGPATGWVQWETKPNKKKDMKKQPLVLQVDKLWEVPVTSEGVVCHDSQDSASSTCTHGLCAGAVVQEVHLHGDRLKFKLLTGSGPDHGWTTVMKDGQPVLQPLHKRWTTRGLTQQHCVHLYTATATRLGQGVNELHKHIKKSVRDSHLYLMAIQIYTYLKTEREGGVLDHASSLEFNVSHELEKVQRLQKEQCVTGTPSPQTVDQQWAPLLHALWMNTRYAWWTFYPWAELEYKETCMELANSIRAILTQAQSQLAAEDFERAGSLAVVLFHICRTLGDHIPKEAAAQTLTLALTDQIQSRFQKFHTDLLEALHIGNVGAFEMLFLRYHRFMKHLVPAEERHLSTEARKLHKDFFESLEDRVRDLQAKLNSLNFPAAADGVHTLRKFGRLLTGAFAVYQEDLRSVAGDPWLRKLGELSTKHFGGKALSGLGRHYAVLQVQPNASPQEIKKAYWDRSREHHPDTHARRGMHTAHPAAMQQRVQQAYEELSKVHVREQYERGLRQPFSKEIRMIKDTLHHELEKALEGADYKRVKELMASCQDLPALAELACPVLDSQFLSDQMREQVKGHVEALRTGLFSNWDKRLLMRMQENLARLGAIEQHLSADKEIYSGSSCRKITKDVEKEIKAVSQEALADLSGKVPTEGDRMHFALHLLRLGRILDSLPQFKDFTISVLNGMLDACQRKPWGHHFLFHVGILLERGSVGQPDATGCVSAEDQRVSRVVVSEFRQFKEVLTVVWNEQTAITQKDVSATLHEILVERVEESGRSKLEFNKGELLECYEIYMREYNKRFHQWVAGRIQLEDLASETMALASELRPACTADWARRVRVAVPVLLAGVFAYFTISESGESYMELAETPEVENPESGDESDGANAWAPERMLKKPHNMQVLAILQLLGCDDLDGMSLRSHLAQIRTGEGKSILLGGCATLLGLLGLRVRVVCYSTYLSDRDWKLFAGIFVAFGVAQIVTYGQIKALCEERIAAKGDLRARTLDLLCNAGPREFCSGIKHQSAAGREADKAEVLLVDEVDVFFGPEFYGQTHNVAACLRDPLVASLLREVWDCHGDALNPQRVLAKIKASSTYGDLLARYPKCQFLLHREVQRMCRDLPNFNIPPYHFNPTLQKIGYQKMDDIDYSIRYGYRTAFAYLNEASKLALRDPDAVLQLNIGCGEFSYAEIRSSCILGVSGTISALGKYEWQVLNRFGIQTCSQMPSVYGPNKLRTLDQEDVKPITISESKDDWFLATTQQVNGMAAKGRASIVVFETSKDLDEYKASSYYRKVFNRNELRESLTHQEKEFAIKKAALSGHTTFTTSSFGRGSDFFCFDRSLQDSGGVHVLMTFFPSEKSLEVQIDGRTARQGQKGSRSMVLLAASLTSTFDVSLDTIEEEGRPSALYKLLSEARELHHQRESVEIEKNLQAATERDTLSHEYFDALLAEDSAKALEAFKRLYAGRTILPQCGLKSSRMVCLVSASGSMKSVWVTAKLYIREMLRRVQEIGGARLELIWMAYRDYSDGPRLLESSSWTQDAENLQEFVDSIEISSATAPDSGEEAVEHALAAAREEHRRRPVTRVLLIGGSGAHPEEAGTYLEHSERALQTDYRLEAERMAGLAVPVYAFYSGNDAKASFTYIANKTGGRAEALTNPNSLIDIVCQTALEDVGGRELVAEYTANYRHTA